MKVQSFQYLGNTIGNTKNNNKCIKERMVMGNKAYYANRQALESTQPLTEMSTRIISWG